MAMKNTKSPNIDGWPPILRLKVIGGPPVTGTPVGSGTEREVVEAISFACKS